MPFHGVDKHENVIRLALGRASGVSVCAARAVRGPQPRGGFSASPSVPVV